MKIEKEIFRVVKYTPEYEAELMELIEREGDDWKIYWEEPNATKYRKSFEKSLTYIALANDRICGYSRSLKDELFIYVCDLLVTQKYRGHELGKKLMQCLHDDYPELSIYVMSGNDEYYQKIGCKKEGSIYSFE